jgi:hypothetical protein
MGFLVRTTSAFPAGTSQPFRVVSLRVQVPTADERPFGVMAKSLPQPPFVNTLFGYL